LTVSIVVIAVIRAWPMIVVMVDWPVVFVGSSICESALIKIMTWIIVLVVVIICSGLDRSISVSIVFALFKELFVIVNHFLIFVS
jgi:hypothetical protein